MLILEEAIVPVVSLSDLSLICRAESAILIASEVAWEVPGPSQHNLCHDKDPTFLSPFK